MAEVLADFCRQKNMDVASCTLLHRGKPVELSAPFRLTGLANNATLTLGARRSSAVPVATLALQFEDGQRVQAKLLANHTLWQVLLAFETQQPGLALTTRMAPQPPSGERKGLAKLMSPKEGPVGWMQPVLTLVNKQFSTVEELTSTTLQSLGVGSGAQLVRVHFEWTPNEAPPKVDATPAALVEAPVVASAAAAAASPVSNANDNNNVGEAPAKSQKTADEDNSGELEPEDNVEVVAAKVPEDRNVVVFQPNDTPFNPGMFEVPDDFFNLSAADMSLLKSAAGKGSEEFLMTREFREKKQLAAYSKFAKTNIRVRFPDRWELQGTFLAHEGTMQLIEFVRQYVEGGDEREFLLYTTPPRQNLENKSFLTQKLMPAAVVYFAWIDKKEGADSYLSDSAKAKSTTLDKTDAHLSTFSSQKPVDYSFEKSGGPVATASASSSDKGKEEAAADPKKKKPGMPSWLKMKK